MERYSSCCFLLSTQLVDISFVCSGKFCHLDLAQSQLSREPLPVFLPVNSLFDWTSLIQDISLLCPCYPNVIPMLSHVIPVDQDFGAGGGRGCYLGDESHQHQSGAAWKGRVTFGVNNIISWYLMGYWIPFKIYKSLLYSHEIWCKVINSIISPFFPIYPHFDVKFNGFFDSAIVGSTNDAI